MIVIYSICIGCFCKNSSFSAHLSAGSQWVILKFSSPSESHRALQSSDKPDDSRIFVLKKALPLTLADLNGKIISFDVSDDADCTVITNKFTGTDVRDAEVCSDVPGGTRVKQSTAAMHPDRDSDDTTAWVNGSQEF